jgi:hypothetical protein
MGNKANISIAAEISANTCKFEGSREANRTPANIAAFNDTGA